MAIVLWVLGEPAIGKTAMVRAMLPRPLEVSLLPERASWTLAGQHVAAAGCYRDQADDGRGVSMSTTSIAWWRANAATRTLTILDGDKARSSASIAAFAGHDLRCVLLEGAALAAERRYRRGFKQSRTAIARDRNLANLFTVDFPGPVARLLADQAPAALAAQVWELLDHVHRGWT